MYKRELAGVSEESKTGILPMNLQLFAEGGEETTEDSSDGADDEDDEADDTDDNSDDEAKGAKGKKKEKTFTQAQVNKMMAKEKRQGRRAALKDYGLDGYSKEEIAEAIKQIESKKSDTQKAAEEKVQEQKKAKELEARTLKAEFKAEALGMNCKEKYIDDVVTLAMAKAAEDEDADVSDILDEIKSKHKVFFKNSSEDGTDEGTTKGGSKRNKSKSGGTGGAPREGSKDGLEKGLGARLAAKRKGKTGESKFFR